MTALEAYGTLAKRYGSAPTSGMMGTRIIFGGRTPSLRVTIVALVLFAFTTLNFLTQSHIHPASNEQSAAALHLKNGPAKPGNLPLGDDSMNCPLCKEILQSGQFFGSAWLVFALPAHVVSSFEIGSISKPRTTQSSFRWNSRAPPHH